MKLPQTFPTSVIGPRFNHVEEIPESEGFVEDGDEAAESELALTVITLLFGLVALFIVIIGIYFAARDNAWQILL